MMVRVTRGLTFAEFHKSESKNLSSEREIRTLDVFGETFSVQTIKSFNRRGICRLGI